MSMLNGKLAVVTGASSGIGRATAEELASLGATVVVNARRKEKLAELVAEIARRGGKAIAVAGDGAKEADIDRLLEESRRHGAGRIDIVVANAGRGLAGGVLSSDQRQWREMYELNVLGTAYLLRRTAAVMVEQAGGDLVVVSSAVGENVSPFSGFYGSSKFAVSAMAEALRREVCSRNVRVMTIKPGIVLSEFQQVAGYTEENFYKGAERYGKLLDPVDVARVIGFAVSQPAHVCMNDIMVRPTKQDYP